MKATNKSKAGNPIRYLIAGLIGLGLASTGNARSGPPPVWPELAVEASILYPERAIRNYEADGSRGLWLEDQQHRWYYGKFRGKCKGMTYAIGMAYDTHGSARLDRSSMILVDDDFCQLESLVTSEKPLPKKERAKVQKP